MLIQATEIISLIIRFECERKFNISVFAISTHNTEIITILRIRKKLPPSIQYS